MSNPFPITPSTPGRGVVELVRLGPSTSVLRTLTYQYPLKLVVPSSLVSDDQVQVQTIYLLTYGGGLVAGDVIDATLSLDRSTRLMLLTQGSTKIFKSPDQNIVSRQHMVIDIAPGAALCYLPDPVQPFEQSCFEQRQTYNLAFDLTGGQAPETGSLCALDWVCEGRSARGEKWSFSSYGSKNELWLQPTGGGSPKKRLLLRDNVLLGHDEVITDGVAPRMDELGVFGTLILFGPLFGKLGTFFMDEFKLLPRIGSRNWDSANGSKDPDLDARESRRIARQAQEKADGLLWSASFLRQCTVVKFGAREVQGGKRWLKTMLEEDGNVPHLFGDRALLCLR